MLGSSSSEKYIKLHTEECLAIERIQTLSKLSKNTQESA
ncbi:hypothetical protein VCHA53O466_50301 [Vibrio chagasii]|nr:hypothetical protein VCHA53O466_50301 [Vibrio chagasii]